MPNQNEPLSSDPFDAAGFMSHGLLYMVNKVVFHPRGYALAINPDDNTFQLLGNGDEPWTFELSSELENERWNAFNALLDSVTLK